MIRSLQALSLLLVCAVVALADDPRLYPATTRSSTTLPTAQAVIDRYIAVTGGGQGHASVKTRRASGIYEMPDLGLEGKLDLLARADGAALLTIDLPGIGVVRQGVTPDGTAWVVHPIDGARILRGDEAAGVRRSLALAADLSLAGYTSSEVVDVVLINGRPTFRMDLVDRSGSKEQRLYDVESGLLVRTLATTAPPRRPTTAATSPTTDPTSITVATFFNDYSDAPPIRLPMRIRQSASGLSPEMILKHVEHNVDLPDALFALPPEVAALKRK